MLAIVKNDFNKPKFYIVHCPCNHHDYCSTCSVVTVRVGLGLASRLRLVTITIRVRFRARIKIRVRIRNRIRVMIMIMITITIRIRVRAYQSLAVQSKWPRWIDNLTIYWL